VTKQTILPLNEFEDSDLFKTLWNNKRIHPTEEHALPFRNKQIFIPEETLDYASISLRSFNDLVHYLVSDTSSSTVARFSKFLAMISTQYDYCYVTNRHLLKYLGIFHESNDYVMDDEETSNVSFEHLYHERNEDTDIFLLNIKTLCKSLNKKLVILRFPKKLENISSTDQLMEMLLGNGLSIEQISGLYSVSREYLKKHRFKNFEDFMSVHLDPPTEQNMTFALKKRDFSDLTNYRVQFPQSPLQVSSRFQSHELSKMELILDTFFDQVLEIEKINQNSSGPFYLIKQYHELIEAKTEEKNATLITKSLWNSIMKDYFEFSDKDAFSPYATGMTQDDLMLFISLLNQNDFNFSYRLPNEAEAKDLVQFGFGIINSSASYQFSLDMLKTTMEQIKKWMHPSLSLSHMILANPLTLSVPYQDEVKFGFYNGIILSQFESEFSFITSPIEAAHRLGFVMVPVFLIKKSK